MINNIIYILYSVLCFLGGNLYNYKFIYNKYEEAYVYFQFSAKEIKNKKNKLYKKDKYSSVLKYNNIFKSSVVIPSFLNNLNLDDVHSEEIMGNLTYFVVASFILALLLLVINSYFSLSVKYLEKGGGFECGFTSFVQTRERFNVIFYRISLLFLIFDLEIILAFPYTVIYQKNQNISKNNLIAFLYILIVGFIYELKEGALNIIKKAHNTEINFINKF